MSSRRSPTASHTSSSRPNNQNFQTGLLVPRLPSDSREAALRAALDAAVAERPDGFRARSLSEIAALLPEALAEEALTSARMITDGRARALALLAFAARPATTRSQSHALLVEALHAAASMGGEALGRLAWRLTPTLRRLTEI
jgi:hypothetical protein